MAPSVRLPNRSYGWLGVLLCLATVELLTRTEVIPSRHLPPPSTTVRTLADELTGESIWRDLASTLAGWSIGLTMASAVAVPLGIAAGSSPVLYRSLRVLIEFLRPVPAVALLPVIVLVYGAGFDTKVFLVALAALWPLLIQTIYGIRDLDPVAIETARAFRAGWADRLARVTLPGALPYIASGFRISSSVALTLAVTAELVLGTDGLGRSINMAAEGGAVSRMYALIAMAGIVGWSLNEIIVRVERRALHWHPSVRVLKVAP